MTGDVIDPLAADVDNAPVAQRFEMLLACPQHYRLPMPCPNSILEHIRFLWKPNVL